MCISESLGILLLAYVSESGENIRINSLSDFGDYIKQNNQSETYS